MKPEAGQARLTLEYSLGELKDKAAARRQRVLLKAAPVIQDHFVNLSQWSREGLGDVDQSVRNEALALYRTTVADGRYVSLLKADPKSAAKHLGMEVSPEALSVIEKITGRLGGDVQGPVEAVIAVAVVIAVAAGMPDEGIVVDPEVITLRARL